MDSVTSSPTEGVYPHYTSRFTQAHLVKVLFTQRLQQRLASDASHTNTRSSRDLLKVRPQPMSEELLRPQEVFIRILKVKLFKISS